MSDSKILKTSTVGKPEKGLPRSRRLRVLKRRSEFLRTFRSGRKVRPAEWVVFNYSISESFGCGWTCPRGVGSAPIRNRMKRWTRDWMRQKMKSDEGPPAVDLNVGFRPMPTDFYRQLKRTDFDQSMERGWKQLLSQVRKTPANQLIKPVTK